MTLSENTLDFTQTGGSMLMANGGTGSLHHRPGLDWLMPVAEVNEMMSPAHDALLVGAADRGRVGEMWKPHVLTRLLNFSRFRCAGLAGRDLTGVGGHAVRSYGESALEMAGRPVHLVHFGGDTLGTGLVEGYGGAVDGEEAERFASIAAIGDREQSRGYARRCSGQSDDLAYVLAAEGELHGAPSSFHAVGLSEPDRLDHSQRERLVSILREAAFVGVREENGADFLESRGVEVHRMPCALSVLPQVCARQLRKHRDAPALEALRNRFPNGWIAVEVGGVRERDGASLAAALRAVAEREGLGLAFFEAGGAACSDGPSERLRRWVESFPEWMAAGFESGHIWEVASMLLHSRLYCGSCLECRILCMAGGVARLNVPRGGPAARSYCELWEHDAVPIEFAEDESWSVALEEALAVDHSLLQEQATHLHETYFSALERFCRGTGLTARLVPGSTEAHHARMPAGPVPWQDAWADEVGRARRRQRRRSGRRVTSGFVREGIRRTLGPLCGSQ